MDFGDLMNLGDLINLMLYELEGRLLCVHMKDVLY